MGNSISFKDVGTKGVRRILEQRRTVPLPIGLKTPLEIDEQGDNIFKMHLKIEDQIDDNLRNLILTNHGERLALYDFGANLRPLLTEWSNKENFDGEAMTRIHDAVSKYMPFVNLIGFESKPDYIENTFIGHIIFLLQYSVPALNVSPHILQIEFFVT